MNGGYREALGFQRALKAAGFKAGSIRYVNTDDGAAWETTLSWRGKKVVRAFNGGFGGPTEVRAILDRGGDVREANRLMGDALKAFYSIREVQAAERAFEMDVFEFSKPSAEERAAKVAELADKVYPIDEERAGDLIADFADGEKEIAKLKRKTAKALCWAEAKHKLGECTSLNVVDTPANREMVQKDYPDRFVGFQGFLTDLLQAG